jgi:hypothetical protein
VPVLNIHTPLSPTLNPVLFLPLQFSSQKILFSRRKIFEGHLPPTRLQVSPMCVGVVFEMLIFPHLVEFSASQETCMYAVFEFSFSQRLILASDLVGCDKNNVLPSSGYT